MIGTVVGNYRIVEKLGDGGMGAVYRAVDELLDREVAVKVLRTELAGQVSLIERFRAEAIALARLNHPRIATLHGLERNGANFVMIMEYVKGQTLEQVVERSGRLSWVRAVEICVDICDALDHAHDKGVVHRDIKPANVMLSNGGLIKVMDFGIARVVGRDRQTQFGHAVGTPMYMAPEQLRGEDVDGRADLYALGAVLFELITGRMAFEADSDYALIMKQLNEPPMPPSALVADVPEAVDAIVLSAMAKARENRHANAAAMRGALRDALRVGARRDPARVVLPPTRIAPAPRAPIAPIAPLLSPLAPPVSAPLAAASAMGMPATRIAADFPPMAGAVPETRFGGDQPRRDIPATRIAASASESPMEESAAVVERMALRDPRRWLAAALIVVAIGAGTMKYLSGKPVIDNDVTQPSAGARVAALPDTARASVPMGGGGVNEPSTKEEVKLPRIGSLQDPGGRAVPSPAPAAPVRGVRGASGGGSGNPPLNDAPRTAPKAQLPPVVAAPPETTVVAPPVSRAPDPSVREAAFRSAATRQVDLFVQAIRERDAATVERALLASGANRSVHDELIALLRAGRVEVSDLNITNRTRTDVGGSVHFDATLNFRSPFGANRKAPSQFVLELSGDGDLRVVSARVLGSPKFR